MRSWAQVRLEDPPHIDRLGRSGGEFRHTPGSSKRGLGFRESLGFRVIPLSRSFRGSVSLDLLHPRLQCWGPGTTLPDTNLEVDIGPFTTEVFA